MENIGVGLMLMVVGMATVFVILLIVIYLSKYLITIVNKVAPEEAPRKVPTVAPTTDAGSAAALSPSSHISSQVVGTSQPFSFRKPAL